MAMPFKQIAEPTRELQWSKINFKVAFSFFLKFYVITLDSGIDIGQQINVGPEKFGKWINTGPWINVGPEKFGKKKSHSCNMFAKKIFYFSNAIE